MPEYSDIDVEITEVKPTSKKVETPKSKCYCTSVSRFPECPVHNK